MKYIDLIANIEIVVNSIRTYKDNYNKNLIIAKNDIDSIINGCVSRGLILDCNIPSIKVYGDVAKKDIKLTCIPANLLTMYMSLTNGYELSDKFHYDNFTHLAETNADFIRDINKRYNNMIRKANLKSNTAEMLDINYYTNSFNLASYDISMFEDILEILIYEFELRCGILKRTTFEVFKDTVYHMIKRVDMLYGLSHEKFDASKAWKVIFSLISYNGNVNHLSMCSDQKFKSLEFIYYPDNLRNRIPKKEYTTPPPPIQKIISDIDKMLKFMQLPSSYNEKQLKKRFRKLAIKFHPDKTGGSSENFVYLKECYEALKKNL